MLVRAAAMEPFVDAARLDDRGYVLNGRKWYASGILDPDCKLVIFMGKSDVDAPAYRQQSMVLVPLDTPGIEILRAGEVTIAADRPFTAYADGDPIAELPVSVRVLPGALRVLVAR